MSCSIAIEYYLITRWTPIKPRKDIASGIFVSSENGWKISAFKDLNNLIAYWYCDIIDIEHDNDTDTYLLNDLLIDIRIMQDGKVEVIDLMNWGQPLNKGLLPKISFYLL